MIIGILDRIRTWLDEDASDRGMQGGRRPAMQLAAAALLAEAAREDGEVSAQEIDVICEVLADHFDLSPEDAKALAGEGEAAQARATGLFRFTRASVDTMNEPQREELVEMMWDVIYADGIVHEFEASLMRRICGLLHVTDRASGEARKRAARRKGVTD